MRRRRSAVIGGLIALSLLLIPLSSIAQADDWIQGDFEAGVGNNVDTFSSPGNVILKGDWNKHPSNPIFNPGPAVWDGDDVDLAYVLHDGITYKMWYSGSDGPLTRIGYATSPDGVSWTKSASNPVLDLGAPGSWNDVYTYAPSVLFDGATYHMWYSGYDGINARTGYATSPDGITWTPYAGNLCAGTAGNGCVLNIGPPGSWDENAAFTPSVLYDGVTYKMWYSGSNLTKGRTGYATSPDGFTWTKNPSNPVLYEGSPGEWDQISAGAGSVIYNGVSYEMWFSGVYSGTEERIGHATSPDGIAWTKNPSNPVLDVGPPGSWDEYWAVYPAVVKVGSEYKMWYTGLTGTLRRMGYASLSYSPSGNLVSVVLDSGAEGTTWKSINWTESLPMGTNITIAVRNGDTLVPGPSWSGWSTEFWDETGSSIALPRSRYFQYRATLTTTDILVTPVLSEVNVNYSLNTAQSPTLASPTNSTWTSDNTPIFTWIHNDGEGDSQGGFTVQIDDDPAFTSIDYTSGDVVSSNSWWIPSSPTLDGAWYWRVRTMDSNNLWSTYSGYWMVGIDATPPTIMSLMENPNPQEVFGNVNVSADVTDNYALDEVWINISGVGNFTMIFDSISGLHFYENSYSILGTSSYTIWANDTFNQWSSASSSFAIQDSTPPTITDILENPDPQEVFSNIEITANIIDNYAVDEVWIDISGEGNYSMSYNSITGSYHYEDSFSSIGVRSFTIWANDTSDNWAFLSSSFAIRDTTPPEISDLVEIPDPQEVDKAIRVSAFATDNIAIDEVWINIEGIGNFTMNYNSSADNYYYENAYQIPGTFSYTIWAEDTSDNWNSASSSFTISKPSDEKPVLDWWWIISAIIIIILIIIILLLLMRRRRKEEEEEPVPSQLPQRPSSSPPQSKKQEEPHTPPPPPPPPPTN
jgi:predicted GH43/DUF377 family glycosyl hydrolase